MSLLACARGTGRPVTVGVGTDAEQEGEFPFFAGTCIRTYLNRRKPKSVKMPAPTATTAVKHNETAATRDCVGVR